MRQFGQERHQEIVLSLMGKRDLQWDHLKWLRKEAVNRDRLTISKTAGPVELEIFKTKVGEEFEVARKRLNVVPQCDSGI